MKPILVAYNLALAAATAGLAPVWLASRLSGRMGDLWPRLGLYHGLPPAPPGPRVWLQAVSVGEVAVAEAVAHALWEKAPQVHLTVTTSTGKGLEAAEKTFGGRAVVAPFPLEVPWAVAAACTRIRPHVYASLETEIWPNLLAFLQAQGARLLLLNGRVSPRSFPGYRKARPLVADALACFDALSMIGPEDAARALALGAPRELLRVDGNAKYARLAAKADPAATAEPARVLSLGGAPLLVAGSVRSGEEEAVSGAFARVLETHPEAVLAVAPRHLEKAPRWLAEARGLGLTAVRWTELSADSPRPKEAQVVVVDVMGQLMALYGLARAAFLGASLVELGGQNPLEPAAWGVPALFGPDMADFAEAAEALVTAGGGRRVASRDELAAAWSDLLARPEEAQAMGARARRVVLAQAGAAENAAALILEQLTLAGALS